MLRMSRKACREIPRLPLKAGPKIPKWYCSLSRARRLRFSDNTAQGPENPGGFAAGRVVSRPADLDVASQPCLAAARSGNTQDFQTSETRSMRSLKAFAKSRILAKVRSGAILWCAGRLEAAQFLVAEHMAIINGRMYQLRETGFERAGNWGGVTGSGNARTFQANTYLISQRRFRSDFLRNKRACRAKSFWFKVKIWALRFRPQTLTPKP